VLNKYGKDKSLEYIRSISAMFIFLCHLFMIYGNTAYAFWLNTGVQLFLIISAYLMAQKDLKKSEIVSFYKKRLSRILLPYEVYLLMVILVLIVIGYGVKPISVLFYMTGMAAFTSSGVLGLGHFWYITILLICYLLVPLLNRIKRFLINCSIGLFILINAAIYSILQISFILFGHAEYAVDIYCFVFAYFYFSRRKFKTTKQDVYLFSLPAFILCGIRIYIDTSYVFADNTLYIYYDKIFVTFSRFFLGIWLFVFLKILFMKIKECKFDQYILKFSNMTYEFYLVHQFVELSVYQYIPYCKNRFILFFIISFVLTLLNIIILQIFIQFIKKCLFRIKKAER
jgi:peptidoglycan/LPS O-acetylase OafA/YrhL